MIIDYIKSMFNKYDIRKKKVEPKFEHFYNKDDGIFPVKRENEVIVKFEDIKERVAEAIKKKFKSR